MTAYTVTVANKTSYRVLVVSAATSEEAVKAFEGYLAAPLQQDYEEFEFNSYRKLSPEREETRDEFVYGFNPADVKIFDGTERLRHYEVEQTVTMLDAGITPDGFRQTK